MNTDDFKERRALPPFGQVEAREGPSPSDYAEMQIDLGLERDPWIIRARMTPQAQMKMDVILETGIERMEFKRIEQIDSREERIANEMKSIQEMLAESHLNADRETLRREAIGNVNKMENRELAVIRRETRVQLDRHERRLLGNEREHTNRRAR